MQYAHVREARFVSRPNRFVARVELDGGVETVHVKNTGRCRELLVPGARVWLSRGQNPGRKTAWDGRCLFPDAPTLRGAKHLRELARLAREGVCAHLVFVVQMAGMRDVAPNAATDPDFARALWEAKGAGVRLHALSCAVTPDSLSITGALPVLVPFPGETS